MGCRLKAIVVLLCAAFAVQAANYDVIVAGLGGTPEYEAQFAKWAADLGHELEANGPATHVIVLSGNSATKEGVQQVMARLASEAAATDSLAVFLIGHGTFDGTDYKLNLPGPDLTAGGLKAMLDHIPATRQLVVNMSSASGASLPVLAKKDRICIAATKSGTERNATIFPRFFIEALRDPAADTDKNGTVTTLEAFRYASQKTAGYFESEKLLATEHPMMTDAATAKGVRDPNPENGQGLLASRFLLLRPEHELTESVATEKQRLIARKEDLEARIDRLKYEKAALSPDEYKKNLTELLLELARTQAEIDR